MGEPTETEVKIAVAGLDAARESLARVGAVLIRPRHLEDNVLFDDPRRSLQGAGAVLRLRRTPHRHVLTYKGPRRMEDGIKVREEQETVVEEPDAVAAILARLGYERIFRYEKYRESWSLRDQEIELDETPIGTFIEIEGDADGIREVTAELGHAPSEYLAESYVGLFVAQGGQGDMIFRR